jgi:glycosyltransferase involved in cell wall biosynthesis
LKNRLRVPVIMNFLDYLTAFMETWPRYLAPRSLIRMIERYEITLPKRYAADGVMTVSDPLADCFAEAGYPRERLRPIYYGYDAQKFRPPAESQPKENDRPVVVMHGSFDHHHLGPIALRTIQQVHQAQPRVVFRFVGRETPMLQRFCARARSLVPALTLECTGFVEYDRVASHLQSATLGIVPYEESLGVHCAFVAKIVEYLGVGLPVASTKMRSAHRYFGNEPAVRFAPFDGDGLAETVLGWLNMPVQQRRDLGVTASRRVAAALDWTVVCRRAVDFVETTAGTADGASDVTPDPQSRAAKGEQ